MSGIGFLGSTAIAAALCYLIAGALFLYVWQLVFRRSRRLEWRKYPPALLVAVATALGVMFALALNVDYPAESSGYAAMGILLISFFGRRCGLRSPCPCLVAAQRSRSEGNPLRRSSNQ